jgi:hypothetical protein
MALANFQKAISEIAGRAGNVFVGSNGSTWYHMGIVKGLSVKATPLVTERDTAGREFQYGYDVEVQMVLMQSAWARTADFSDLMDSTGNGIYFKLTDRPATTAGASAATGVTLQNAIASVSPEFMFSSAESGVTITIRGHVSKTAFNSFTASGGTLVFDL